MHESQLICTPYGFFCIIFEINFHKQVPSSFFNTLDLILIPQRSLDSLQHKPESVATLKGVKHLTEHLKLNTHPGVTQLTSTN